MAVEKPLLQSAAESDAEAAAAAELKKQGNAAFGAGAHEEAVRLYSEALLLAPTADRHPILGNRSAARLKLSADAIDASAASALVDLAVSDAHDALKLDPKFIKGYYRLGSALLAKGQSAGAVAALEAGLTMAPHNSELRAVLRDARGAVEQERREILKAAKEAASLASEGRHLASEGRHQAAPKKVIDYDAAAATAARASALAQEKRTAAAGAKAGADAAGGAAGSEAGGTTASGAEAPPATAQQFDLEWKALRSTGASLEEQRAWLMRLPVSSYSNLFKESLGEGTLMSVVECVHACVKRADPSTDEAERCLTFANTALDGLSSTRRFSMLLMFLDEKQKAIVKSIFDEMKRLGTPASAALRATWGLQFREDRKTWGQK